MKDLYTRVHSPGGKRWRKKARDAEAWIRDQIRMSFVTEEEFSRWEVRTRWKQWRNCTACLLHGESRVVLGRGTVAPDLVVVGGAPGEEDEETGKAFVGEEGRLLIRLLKMMGFRMSRVFLTSAVLCRPPEDRLPTKEERDSCQPKLLMILASLKPRAILLLGSVAVKNFGYDTIHDARRDMVKLGKLDRTRYAVGGDASQNLVGVFATYDPSRVLRSETREDRRLVLKRMASDLRFVKVALEEERGA